ncbi:MAG: 4Fe-4S binding protein [Oscillospiraceae bacterium]|nr:4Fe-4S binding protein [Oscillospiraceae bacterium]
MNIVCYFSGSGHSKAIAEYFADKLGWDMIPIGAGLPADCTGTAVIVFPVYCQNIPPPVRRFLKAFRPERAVLIAAYGRVSPGNVLYEGKKLLRSPVIAGACIPTGHTFLQKDYSFDTDALQPIFGRIAAPQNAVIPKLPKDFFADLFPAWRSRVSVRIIRNDSCTRCGLCRENCPMNAITDGKPDRRCIRCLRCVTECPQNALRFENSRLLARYLAGHDRREVQLFL